jgi:hypothetical protein
MGPDGQPEQDDEGNAIMALHDLTVGKYDLTVTTGPSFTTKREEAAMQMTEFVRSFPAAAPVIGDLLAKNLDWPGADEIADRLKSLNPALQNKGLPPEVQQMVQQGQQAIQQLQLENQQLKTENQSIKAGKEIDAFNAQTDRMKVEGQLNNESAKTAVSALSHLAKPHPQQNPTSQG